MLLDKQRDPNLRYGRTVTGECGISNDSSHWAFQLILVVTAYTDMVHGPIVLLPLVQ